MKLINPIHIGPALKHLRLRAGLTQMKLATACGFTLNTVAALEQNRRHPSPRTLAALARVLSVETEELTGGTP